MISWLEGTPDPLLMQHFCAREVHEACLVIVVSHHCGVISISTVVVLLVGTSSELRVEQLVRREAIIIFTAWQLQSEIVSSRWRIIYQFPFILIRISLLSRGWFQQCVIERRMIIDNCCDLILIVFGGSRFIALGLTQSQLSFPEFFAERHAGDIGCG